MVAAISDWGGYALAAMLAYLHHDPSVLVRVQEVETVLSAVVGAGAVDGATARPVLCDDGVPLAGQKAYVGILEVSVHQAMSTLQAPGH